MAKKSENGVAFFERGSWYHRIRFYDEDYIVRYGKKGGFKTPEDAEKSYYKYLQAFEEQKTRLRQQRDNSLELKQYLQSWLERQSHFTTTTKKVYQCVLEKALPMMQEIRLCIVNENYIDAAVRMVSVQTRSYGLKLYELFSMALSDAFSDGLIDHNPMKYCKRPVREKTELRILNEQEKKIFLQYAKGTNWYLEITLCMFCGLKRGEVYALRLSDFDFNRKTVSIKNQIVGEYRRGQNGKVTSRPVEKKITKENGRRVIGVPDSILKDVEIRKMEKEGEALFCGDLYQNRGLLCCQKNGDYRSLSSLDTALRKICRKMGIEKLSAQDLRDMYAEMMLKSEQVSFLTLTGLMGYSSIEETYERYSSLVENDFSHNKYIDKIF